MKAVTQTGIVEGATSPASSPIQLAPTPWHVGGREYAAYIVQAVNEREALIAKNRALAEALEAMALAWELTRDGHRLGPSQSQHAFKLRNAVIGAQQ